MVPGTMTSVPQNVPECQLQKSYFHSIFQNCANREGAMLFSWSMPMISVLYGPDYSPWK